MNNTDVLSANVILTPVHRLNAFMELVQSFVRASGIGGRPRGSSSPSRWTERAFDAMIVTDVRSPQTTYEVIRAEARKNGLPSRITTGAGVSQEGDLE